MNPLNLILALQNPYAHLFKGVDEKFNNWEGKGHRIYWADETHKIVLDFSPETRYIKPSQYTIRFFKRGRRVSQCTVYSQDEMLYSLQRRLNRTFYASSSS